MSLFSSTSLIPSHSLLHVYHIFSLFFKKKFLYACRAGFEIRCSYYLATSTPLAANKMCGPVPFGPCATVTFSIRLLRAPGAEVPPVRDDDWLGNDPAGGFPPGHSPRRWMHCTRLSHLCARSIQGSATTRKARRYPVPGSFPCALGLGHAGSLFSSFLLGLQANSGSNEPGILRRGTWY
jgi:hypothetical protein